MRSSPAQLPQPSSSQAEQSVGQQVVPPPSRNPRYNLRYTLSGHRQSISSLKFSPDGSILASAGAFYALCEISVDSERHWREGADKLIKLWDGITGQILNTLEGHTEGISDIAWASNGEYLASASDDKTIKIWSIEEVSHL